MKEGLKVRTVLKNMDGAVNGLVSAWDGDDRLHYGSKWDEARNSAAALAEAEQVPVAMGMRLVLAARIYKAAQTDVISAARRLNR